MKYMLVIMYVCT